MGIWDELSGSFSLDEVIMTLALVEVVELGDETNDEYSEGGFGFSPLDVNSLVDVHSLFDVSYVLVDTDTRLLTLDRMSVGEGEYCGAISHSSPSYPSVQEQLFEAMHTPWPEHTSVDVSFSPKQMLRLHSCPVYSSSHVQLSGATHSP